MATYKIERTGINVEELLDKIDDLAEATSLKSGLLSAADKAMIDGLDDSALTNIEIENLLT